MKTCICLCLLALCAISPCFAQDAYSLAHPNDTSHHPSDNFYAALGKEDGHSFDGRGRTVTYKYIPGTAYAHKVIVSGAGNTPDQQRYFLQHFSPAPVVASRSAPSHSSRSVHEPSPHASGGLDSETRSVSVRPFNPIAVIFGLVVFFVAAAGIGYGVSRRSSPDA